MPTNYTVRAGDSLANIAFDHGLLAEQIWGDAGNAALRARRPDMNILMPGDVLVIPDKRPQVHALATAQRHRFKLKGVPHVFRLQLIDDGEPRARQPYTLQVQRRNGPPVELSGRTADDGTLTARVPPGAVRARLAIDANDEFEALELEVLLGSLDPIEELTGVQKRLVNLGFDCPVDGQSSQAMALALAAFQRMAGLAITGEVDAGTRAQLVSLNDEAGNFSAFETPA